MAARKQLHGYLYANNAIAASCFSSRKQELMLLAMSGTNGEQDSETKTLADVLASKEEAQFVRPRHTVREAAGVIASQRKAVLVVEEGELVGIFTPKDMMTRVIAKVCRRSIFISFCISPIALCIK